MNKQRPGRMQGQRRQRTISARVRKTLRTPEQHQAEAIHWNTLGDTYSALGLMRRAITCYKRSRTLAQRIDPQEHQPVDDWNLLTKVGMAYQMLGETRCAISYHLDSLHLARTLGDMERQLAALRHLSGVYETLGYIHHAVACHIRSISLYR